MKREGVNWRPLVTVLRSVFLVALTAPWATAAAGARRGGHCARGDRGRGVGRSRSTASSASRSSVPLGLLARDHRLLAGPGLAGLAGAADGVAQMRRPVAQRGLHREPVEARAEQRFPEIALEAVLEEIGGAVVARCD